MEQASIIQHILHRFCEASGQKVSQDKTRVFFSENVPRLLKADICQELGFQMTNDLGKYLGIPIFHKRVGINTFKFVIDKVNQRLSTWKARTLSFAGRVTLAKSVAQAMPTYIMQACELPRGICDEVDKLCRNFVWGDEPNQRKVHLLSWDKMCLAKKEGGLGFRSTRQANSAFLQKGLWEFCSQPESMWAGLLRRKYNCGRYGLPRVDVKKVGSNYWKGLAHEWNSFRDNLNWKLGNGEDIRFWKDDWLPNYAPLSNYCNVALDENDLNLPVSFFVQGNGEWKAFLFEHILPNNITQHIIDIHPPSILHEDDHFSWGVSPNGRFSTQSAYKAISRNTNQTTDPIFKLIWKWKGPERIRTFLWKLAHEALLTNVERTRRHMADPSPCPVCGIGDESLLHRFRNCCNSRSIWNSLNYAKPSQFYSNMHWKNWLLMNLNFASTWSVMFGVSLDQMWRNRNLWVFSHKASSTVSSIESIMHQVEWIVNGSNQFGNLQLANQTSEHWNWTLPPKDFCKLNCDGSVSNNGRNAGCGGVLRDDAGNFIFAFSQRLDDCSVIESELWGVYHGLCIAWRKGFKKIVVESNSCLVVELLSSFNRANHPHQQLIDGIKAIGGTDAEFELRKIDRLCNCVADLLAKHSVVMDTTCNIFSTPPDFLTQALNIDKVGLPSGSV